MTPGYYQSIDGKLDVIEVMERFGIEEGLKMQAIQYLFRAGKKPGESERADISKAISFLNRRLQQLDTPPALKPEPKCKPEPGNYELVEPEGELDPDNNMVGTKTAAKLLGVTVKTVCNYRQMGLLKAVVKYEGLRRKMLFSLDDIEEFIAARRDRKHAPK